MADQDAPPLTDKLRLHLPEELWLQILSYVDPKTIWKCIRLVNKQLLGCSESHINSLSVTDLPHFSIGTTISLGSGSRHHWYDIRASITFNFHRLHSRRPGHAVFGFCQVMPPQCYDVAMKQWNHLVVAGSMSTKQDWKLQMGQDLVKKAKLRTLVVAGPPGAAAVSCAWTELLCAYHEDHQD